MTTDPKYAAPQRKLGPMSEDEFQANLRILVREAEDYIKDEVSAERERNWRYWNGKCDLPAQKDRNSLVSTDVYDIVEAAVPQLMKIFYDNDQGVVEFSADKDLLNESELILASGVAKVATAACNNMFRNLAGWQGMNDWLRDALIAKIGVWKFFHTKERTVKEEILGPLSLDQFDGFLAGYEGEIVAVEGNQEVGPVSVHTRTSIDKPKYILEAVPNEEFIINREAKNEDDAWIIGQRSLIRVSDAVAMGIPYEMAMRNRSTETENSETEQEREARRQYTSRNEDATSNDGASWTVKVYDLWVRVDKNGDGFAELRHVVAVGYNINEIVSDEVVDDHPYSIASPIRVPHTAIGRALADVVIDLQDQNTFTLRQILDNLAWANNPRTAYVENQVNLTDLLNNKYAGTVECRQPNAVWTLDIPFVADQSLPILEYLKERRQFRTGISDESMGLNAESLQSSTEIGVRAVIGQAQYQVQMMARTLAETGIASIFRKMLKVLSETGAANIPREITPYIMENLKVGLATTDSKATQEALIAVAQKQEQILLQMGAQNPLVSVAQYAATLDELISLSPLDGQYFTPPEALANWQPPPKQDPEVAKAQAKQQTDMAKIQSDFTAKVLKIQADAQADRMEAATEAATDLQVALIQARQDTDDAQVQSALKQHELMLEAILEKYKIDMKTESDTRLRAVT